MLFLGKPPKRWKMLHLAGRYLGWESGEIGSIGVVNNSREATVRQMGHLNFVRLNSDDLIEVIYRGDQTQETVTAASQAAKMLADRLRRRGNPILVLVNLEDVGRSDMNARRASAQSLKKFDFEKVAVFGASRVIGKAVDLIIRAVGKEQKIKVFSSRQSAVAWLFGLPDPTNPAVVEQLQHDDYREHVKQKINELNDIISLATIGEYAKDIEIPEKEDEFTDTFVGLKLLVETLEEKANKLNKLANEDEPKAKSGTKRVFFNRKLPSPHSW